MALAKSLWSGRLMVEHSEIMVTINFQENSKRKQSTFNWGSETSAVNLKRYPKGFLKASSSDGEKINLNKYLKVTFENWIIDIRGGIDLVSYLRGGGKEKYIGYLKPDREELTPVILVLTEVNNQLKLFGFCVDIPLDQPQPSPSDRVLIFSTFHTLLMGRVCQEQGDRITKDLKTYSATGQKDESEMTEQPSCDNSNTWGTDECKREIDDEENENECTDCGQWSCWINGDDQEKQVHRNNNISTRQLPDINPPTTATGAQEKANRVPEVQKLNPYGGNCQFCSTEEKTIYHLRQSAECRANYEALYGQRYKLEIQKNLYKQTRVKKRVGKVAGPSVCKFCPAPADKLLLVHLRNSAQCSIRYQEQYSQHTEEDMRREIKKEKARMRKRKQRGVKS